MKLPRTMLMREAAARGKYAPLHKYLCLRAGREWRTTFSEIEGILGFALPSSARIHRPWWSNPGPGGGHSHALAWAAAGWKAGSVDLEAGTLIFVRREDGTGREEAETSTGVDGERPISVDDLFVAHDFGPWPDGLRWSREEMYGDDGR